jgi:murein DD-endopeptidase MepM/ murein hydrolase activator NlpD
MKTDDDFYDLLARHRDDFLTIIKPDAASPKLGLIDLSVSNIELSGISFLSIPALGDYILNKLRSNNLSFLIGGYGEIRSIYRESILFNSNTDSPNQLPAEPRSLHLGLDIWGAAGTPVFAPYEAHVHSFQYNNAPADYGATIILEHEIDGNCFFTLYGHLSLKDIEGLRSGNKIKSGEEFAHFGIPKENGGWPPHLHFQIIHDLQHFKGDYPGVCKLSEREFFLKNCPDPDMIFNMRKYALTVCNF